MTSSRGRKHEETFVTSLPVWRHRSSSTAWAQKELDAGKVIPETSGGPMERTFCSRPRPDVRPNRFTPDAFLNISLHLDEDLLVQAFAIKCRETGLSDDERHGVVMYATTGPVPSRRMVRTDEVDVRWRTLPKVHTDQLTLDTIDGRRVVTGPKR